MTHPIIQAPPVTNATTGFGPSVFFGKYRSSLNKKDFTSHATNSCIYKGHVNLLHGRNA